MVDMLDVVSIPVGDDTIECWMDIQRGKYPEVRTKNYKLSK